MTYDFTKTGALAEAQGPSIPTIETTGTAVRQQLPSTGTMTVTVTGKAPTREGAWTKFQENLAGLTTAVGEHGEVGNAVPRESEEEISKVMRSSIEFVVTAEVDVTFEPNKYGHIVEAILACNLPLSAPEFTYDKVAKVTPELLTAAAADARINAIAVTAGVGARIGRLVAINVGPPQMKRVYRPADVVLESFQSVNIGTPFLRAAMAFDVDKLETYDTEVQVTVEYEVIEIDAA